MSLAIQGGPRYGIDFKGGALMYVKFADEAAALKDPAALAPKIPGGGTSRSGGSDREATKLIIGTEMQDEKTLAR